MPRKAKGKGKQAKAIEKAERDAENWAAGIRVPTQLAPQDKAANARLEEQADELGLELDPNAKVRLLKFNDKRQWRSTEMSPREYLEWYGEGQKYKFEPKVYPNEMPDRHPPPGFRKDADHIRWFQKARFHYYNSQGRLRHLQALENTKNWPNMPGLMTKAPFVRTTSSEHPYVENPKNRTLGFFKALNVREIGRLILMFTAQTGYLELSNISRTCHAGLDITSKYIEHWDETPPGDFLGEDVSVNTLDEVQRTPVTLIISPIRKDFDVKAGKRPDISFSEHYMAQTKLYRALNNRAVHITNLQLHRIQFLNLDGVRCTLESLPNLEIIGIYQCQLLHLGTMAKLLDIVKTNGQRKDGSFVDLDFFPMFHEGPNSITRHGSYGAVWNHPDCDMATGIWELILYEIYPKARALDIDILSWGRAFRLFLEKLPMRDWAVVRIIEAIKSFEHSKAELIMTSYNEKDGKWVRFADDVTAALRGDNNEPAIVKGKYLNEMCIGGGYQPNLRRKYGWWRAVKQCVRCNVKVLAIFCPFREDRCWGCLAKENLEDQYDHFMSFKAYAAEAWFGPCQNLDEVVSAGAHDEGYRIAQNIDKFRLLEMEYRHDTEEKDWVDHHDFDHLHRRYARRYEPHGPIDRKLSDRQYYRVGHYPSPITSNMVPECYPEFKLNVWMNDWETKRKQSHPDEPETERALARQKFLKNSTKLMEDNRASLIQKQNSKDANDVEKARDNYTRRQLTSCYGVDVQVKCCDEITEARLETQYPKPVSKGRQAGW